MSSKKKTQPQSIKSLSIDGYQKKTEQYKFTWVNEESVPSQWMCMVCTEPLQDPWMHNQCDKFFCFKCVKQARYKCPQCRRGHSTEWSGKVGYSVNASLAQLKVQCSKCQACTEYGEIESHLQFHCILLCELNCGVQVHGSIGQKNHLPNCANAKQYCEYNKVGCLYIGNFDERQLHESTCEYKQVFDLVHSASRLLEPLKQAQKAQLKQDLLQLVKPLEDRSKWLQLDELVQFKAEDANLKLGYIKQYNAQLKQVSIMPVSNDSTNMMDDSDALVWFPIDTEFLFKVSTVSAKRKANLKDYSDSDEELDLVDSDVDEHGNLAGFIDYDENDDDEEEHNTKKRKKVAPAVLETIQANAVNGPPIASQYVLDWQSVLQLLLGNNVNTCMCLVSKLFGTCKSNCATIDVDPAESNNKRRKIPIRNSQNNHNNDEE